jgi:hypothetical protein
MDLQLLSAAIESFAFDLNQFLFGLIVGRNFMHDVYGRKEMLSRIV